MCCAAQFQFDQSFICSFAKQSVAATFIAQDMYEESRSGVCSIVAVFACEAHKSRVLGLVLTVGELHRGGHLFIAHASASSASSASPHI